MEARTFARIVLLLSALAASVRTQTDAPDMLVLCRTTLDCSGTSNQITLKECCLGDGNLAYTMPGEERCNPCIVIGWLNDSFTGLEQSHTLNVGYIKGAAQAGVSVTFKIEPKNGTAIHKNDFELTTTEVKVLYQQRNLYNVLFKFNDDGVAQEPNETLSFELVPTNGKELFIREGVIFKNIVDLTIVDSDSVEIKFTEDDYSVSEGENMSIFVTKSAKIGSPVTLNIIPLTVDNAKASLGPLPAQGIPDDNPHSPNRASIEDFNATVITITFKADEYGKVNNEKNVSIHIFDDEINEADKQVFVVQLRLVNRVNSDTIRLSRPASLCKIADNDPIRIGFVQPEYSYTEPQEETIIIIDEFYEPEPGPIFLEKEGGVVTEQTFIIPVSTTSTVPSGRYIRPATLGTDYEIETNLIEIGPSDQSVNFNFTLLADSDIEGKEAFQARISTDDTGFLSPKVLSSETLVVIEDDDCISVKVKIGFEHTRYVIHETVEKQEIVIKVIEPRDDVELPATVYLSVQTKSVTATGGVDYGILTTQDVIRKIDDKHRRQSFDLFIYKDRLVESDEELTIELMFDPATLSQCNIILDPNVTTIKILDDGAVRLVNGRTEREGRVEVRVNGEWGTVCDDEWGFLDGVVVCRELGYATVDKTFGKAAFGRGRHAINLDNVNCTGIEKRLLDCESNEVGKHNCGHLEDAGVRCREETQCTHREIRLRGKMAPRRGHLEVCAFGVWGTVCDDYFDSKDASVVCRQLGYSGGSVLRSPGGKGPILLDDLMCTGMENNLFDCFAAEIGVTQTCGHAEDVGVACEP